MKRSLPRKDEPSLGASEFAATLNGEDPRAILSVLKGFARSVRKQRRRAIANHIEQSDDSETDDESAEEDDKQQDMDDVDAKGSQKKRFKKSEEWKEDTQSYHVPFVGTSVVKGDLGTFVPGEWPTGMLNAYLQKSPLAAELTGSDLIPPDGSIHKSLIRKKKGKLSKLIYKAYLRAVVELLTAAIPPSKLQRELFGQEVNSVKIEKPLDVDFRFLSVFASNRLSGICNLLNEETDKGHGKTGIVGGCGPLAAPALQVLGNLAMTSIANARLVANSLNEVLSEGVLRVLLRTGQKKSEEDSDIPPRRSDARVHAINLARILLQTNDSLVAGMICSSGNKDQKVKPGILLVAMRVGLSSTAVTNILVDADDEHLDAIGQLLQTIRIRLVDQARLVSRKTFQDFISRDVMQNLCKLSSYAPPLVAPNSFKDVLSASDKYPQVTNLQSVGVEARRLLFPLISDTKTSPYSYMVSRADSIDRQNLTRVVIATFQSARGGLETRNFLVHCVKTNPGLLSELFKSLQFPEISSPFEFLYHLEFVSTLMRFGPTPLDCLKNNQVQQNQVSIDETLLTLFPMRLKKQPLGRAIQNGNPLIVLSCFKLIVVAVERFGRTKMEGLHLGTWSHSYITDLSNAFIKWLPDLQIILSIRSKFNAFSHNKANMLVYQSLFRVLDSYTSVLPSSIRESHFDWFKLLPTSSATFSDASSVVQERLFNSLELILDAREGLHGSPLYYCKVVIEVMLTTRLDHIQTKARCLVLRMLSRLFQTSNYDEDSMRCLEYEATCWVDGLTMDSLSCFCKILQEASSFSLKSIVSVGQALTKAGLSGSLSSICISPLLTLAITRTSESSSSFSILSLQVAAQCLFYHRDPIPLAALIVNSSDGDAKSSVMKSRIGESLSAYSLSLLDAEMESQAENLKLLSSLVSTVFSKRCLFYQISDFVRESAETRVCEGLLQPPLSQNLAIVASRFLIHILNLSGGFDPTVKKCIVLLRRTIPVIIQCATDGNFDETRIILNGVFSSIPNKSNLDIQTLDIVLMSCPGGNEVGPVRARIDGLISSLSSSDATNSHQLFSSKEKRRSLLLLSLLGSLIPLECIAEVKLSLLERFNKEEASSSRNLSDSWTLSYIKDTDTSSPHKSGHRLVSIGKTIEAWWSLANPSDAQGILQRAVASHLACTLQRILIAENVEAALVYARIIQQDSDMLVRRCLPSALSKAQNAVSPNPIDLLTSLVQLDCDRYIPPFLDLFSQGGSALLDSWNAGILDELVLVIVRFEHCFIDPSDAAVYLVKSVIARASRMLSKFVSSITRSSHTGEAHISQPLFFENSPTIIQRDHKQIDKADMLLEIASEVCTFPSTRARILLDEVIQLLLFISDGRVDIPDTSTETNLYRLGFSLLQSFDFADYPSGKQSLAAALLARLSKIIPNALKNDVDSKKARQRRVVQLAAMPLLAWLLKLIEEVEAYDEGIVRAEGDLFLNRLLRACLKHGVTDEEGPNPKLPILCLQLIHSILTHVYKPSAPLRFVKKILTLPSASEIFTMATSHSKFHSVMSCDVIDEESTGDVVQLELLRILACCVVLEPDEIVVERGVWQAIFSAFNAGLGQRDIIIRQFFLACHKSKNEKLPFLHEFRWKGISKEVGGSEGLWDWLLNGLDASRIRTTLLQFPVYDTLNMTHRQSYEESENSTKSETFWSENSNMISDPHGIDDVEGEEEADQDFSEVQNVDDNSEVMHDDIKDDLSINDLALRTKWNGSGPDTRYSPAFLLPVILGALENGLSNDEGEADASLGDTGPTHSSRVKTKLKHNEKLAQIAQRLCEKGVLSLSLAALCSKCDQLRKLAVSILGLFLRALNSKEALEASSWRERPQLAMLLNSVQRAMVLSCAWQGTSFPSSEVSPQVKMLPGLVALFLARASLVMMNPKDNLYVPLNRFFLKTEVDYGAFQDFNRLPAFMSLFCSSSDEIGQARKERLWALQLVRDGCVDATCYRLVSSCHAPELILTSFTNFRARKVFDDREDSESSLLLDVIATLIRCGGPRAFNQLVGRMGLLSWLRSISVEEAMVEMLRTSKSKMSFFNLVCVVVDRILCHESTMSVATNEISALAEPVLQLCFQSRKGLVTRHGPQAQNTERSLVPVACNVLASMRRVMLETTQKSNMVVRSGGISIVSCNRFIQLVPLELKHTALTSICSLPLRFDVAESNEASDFYTVLLRSLQQSDPSIEALNVGMARCALLATHFGDLLNTNSVLRMLVPMSGTFQSNQTRQLWLDCLRILSTNQSERNFGEVEIAKEILKANPVKDDIRVDLTQ